MARKELKAESVAEAYLAHVSDPLVASFFAKD